MTPSSSSENPIEATVSKLRSRLRKADRVMKRVKVMEYVQIVSCEWVASLVRKRLSGFKSRWTIPFSCAAANP
jgi:hypothetical protein